jgi:N-acetylglutamate synthase-like GNAT family acetyltransferase
MDLLIRRFVEGDAAQLVDILTRNEQFGHPEVEGIAAMRRVASCEAAVFLVAQVDGQAVGLVRAVYDGSRALIHLLSVSPRFQHRGIGRALVNAVQVELRGRGAPSVSVTVTDTSAGFWQKQGFEVLPVYLMLKEQI